MFSTMPTEPFKNINNVIYYLKHILTHKILFTFNKVCKTPKDLKSSHCKAQSKKGSG